MKRIHAYISGMVQGVFFRANTKRAAENLAVTGWVRNLDDGRVEVVAEGNEENIRDFMEFLRRGPPSAEVEDIEILEEKYKGEFNQFEITF